MSADSARLPYSSGVVDNRAMLRPLRAAVLGILLCLAAPAPGPALAQSPVYELSDSLARLQNNPRYHGRVLSTHIRRQGGRALYEVRILRPDDRVILVYIDPNTGGVVGDSERSRRPSGRNRGR